MPPHPSLRDTFSPRAKALMAVPLFIQRTYGSLPGDVSTAQRTTRCFAQHDIIFNLQYMVVCLPLRFAEVSELKERNSTANCSLTVSGVARCCQLGTFRKDSEGLETHREPAAGEATYHKASIGEAARGISRSHIGNTSAGPLALTKALRRPF